MRRWLLGLLAASACTEVERDTAPREPWTEAPEMPGRRLEAGVAALGTRLAVVGGFSTTVQEGLAITHEALALDTLERTWSSLPDAPVAWTHPGLAAAGGSLYLLGGLEGADFIPRGEAFVLPPGGSAWLPLAPMPAGEEKGAAAVISAPPQLFVIGGADRQTALASVLVYNTIRDEWSKLPDLPRARSHPFAMRQSDGTLIVGGGLADLNGFALGDVYALRQGGMAWELRATMPTPRGGCAYGVALGQLVCAGGEAGGQARTEVASYDPIGDAWTVQPEMPAPRAGAQGAVIGQQLYVVGGAEALVFEPTSRVLVFSLLDTLPRS